MKDLTAQARLLADRVSALSTAVETLDRRTNRGEKVVVAVVAALALTIILSVTVAIVLFQLQDNSERIAAAQEREAHTRQDALCPLYGLILGSFNPDSRPEGPAREQYIHQFDVMRQAYAALDCSGPLVPPATRR